MDTEDVGLQKALNLSYFYLKFRPRSVHEVEEYLKKKSQKHHFSTDIIGVVIQKLLEKNFLNDREFIDWYIRSRMAGKPRGVRLLRLELQRFGIAKDLLDESFEESKDEEADIVRVLDRKWNQYRDLDERKRFERAMSYLMRKGFSYTNSQKAIAFLKEKE